MSEESNDTTWYWLKPDREQGQGSLEELRELLSKRALPRSTLVWFDPWPEWLPATKVAELASAIPPSGREQRSAARARGEGSSAPSVTPAPQSVESVKAAPATAKSEPVAQVEATPSVPAESATAAAPESSLEPAVPVPSALASKAENEKLEPVAVASAAPKAEPVVRIPAMVAPSARDRLGSLDGSLFRRPTTASEAPIEVSVRAPAQASPSPPSRGTRTALLVTSVACIALALGLGLTLRALVSQPKEAASAPAVQAVVAPPALPAGCALVAAASKLAPSIERETTPALLALNGDRVAIGFAAAPKRAAGVVVELATLDARAAFDESGERRVVAATPTTESPLTFAVDRELAELDSPASLDTAQRRLLGVSERGLVARGAGEDEPALLWPLSERPVTPARIARLAAGEFLLALRAGGVQGDIVVGFLGADGRPLGELAKLSLDASFVGTPAVAAGPAGALLAVAARSVESEPWRLKLVRVSADRRVEAPLEFALPAEDLGAGAIAPALSPLPDNRWLLQWTQGETGRLRVRVQALSAELSPLGSPVVVSPMGANAGQGSVWTLADKTLSLFVLPVPGRDELWGAVLKCR